MGGIHSAAPTTGSASGLGLGDSMRDAIDSAGTFGQIPCLILLIIRSSSPRARPSSSPS